MIVKLASEPSLNDLDRIQDLFPVDDLLLYDSDPLSPRLKSPSRKRSSTTSRLHRALSGKNKIVPTEKNGERTEHHSDVISKTSHESSKSLLQFQHPNCGRRYVMEAPVQLISGVQSQDRHLFLLNDLLIVAKSRASGVYKLKEKVRVAELWLSNSCLEVVCEVPKNGDTAFVMGWPTTNVVVNFSSTHTRDLWLAKLKQLISEEQQKGPESTSIRVHYWDPNTKEEYAHNITVSRKDNVVDCIGNTLAQLRLDSEDVGHYQLWVKTDRDTAPYPLIGHESPLAIKMNCLFTALTVTGEDAFDLDYCRSINISNCPALKCYFILRSTRRGSFDLVSSKKGKRVKRSPILPKVFRRSLSKPELSEPSTTCSSDHQLFGQPLDKLVHNGALPKNLMTIFYKLYESGPYTVGIFRKSANARVCRELREKLNVSNENCSEDLSSVNIFVLAVLIKEFLRSLPDCLLMCQLYLEWLAITCLPSDAVRIKEARRLMEKLPTSNEIFLKHFLCVLWHVQNRSSENMMTATNLAVCVGPSLLWSKDCNTPTYSEQSEASKQVPNLVEFLIKNCRKVFGEECLTVFSHVKQRDISRQDSGNEESESLHSLQSSHSSGELRRDDSSIDSLERAIMGVGDHSPKLPTKTKMSLTNLSRDSGLTMSDTQLYTPDEEVDGCDNNIMQLGSDSTLTHSISNSPSSSLTDGTGDQPLRRNNWPKDVGGKTSVRPKSSNCIETQLLDPSYWQNDQKLDLRTNGLSNGHYGHHPQSVQNSSTSRIESMMNEANDTAINKSVYPLGSRKDLIKRRLSRSRPWVRPPLRYEQESGTFYPQENNQLRRSASEESIVSVACLDFASNPTAADKHHASVSRGHSTQWLPPVRRNHPRTSGNAMFANMIRSKSAFRVADGEESNGVHYLNYERSPEKRFLTLSSTGKKGFRHSTTPSSLEHSNDFTYDSSTLSDDDSTPRISRNNSRGKEGDIYGNSGAMTCTNAYGNLLRTVGCEGKQHQLMDAEIHHASPITIDMSDEEYDISLASPPPPLPPKPMRLQTVDYLRSFSEQGFDDSINWNSSVRGVQNGDFRLNRPARTPHDTSSTVISVGGQRVLTATAQNIYDVPPWKPTSCNNNSSSSNGNSRPGRSATLSSRSTRHRAKSQPPPQNRNRQSSSNGYHHQERSSRVNPAYDVMDNRNDRTINYRNDGKNRDPSNVWKHFNGNGGSGAETVGRTIKKEISWSVSQLKALFSRSKDHHYASSGDDHSLYQKSLLSSSNSYSNYASSLPPPPYRPPPSLLNGDENCTEQGRSRASQKTEHHWSSTLKRNRNKLKLSASSSESQGSVSGEESYV